jgi:hypothetical protein
MRQRSGMVNDGANIVDVNPSGPHAGTERDCLLASFTLLLTSAIALDQVRRPRRHVDTVSRQLNFWRGYQGTKQASAPKAHGRNSELLCYEPSAQPGVSGSVWLSSSTYERCIAVGLLLPSSRTPTVTLRYLGLGSATTTPERAVVLGFRAIPNFVNRTRSPSWSSRSIFLCFLDIHFD